MWDALTIGQSANGHEFSAQFCIIRRSKPYVRILTIVTHDLYSDRPWAFSPFFATMFRVRADRTKKDTFAPCKSAQDCFNNATWPNFPQPGLEGGFIEDDISPLFYRVDDKDGSEKLIEDVESNEDVVKGFKKGSNASKNRVSWMGSKEHRKKLEITPDDVITAEFGNGYVRTQRAYRRSTSTRTCIALICSLEAIIPYAGLRFSCTFPHAYDSAKVLQWPACALQVQKPDDRRGIFCCAVRIWCIGLTCRFEIVEFDT